MATDAVQIEVASEVSAVSESSLIRVLPRESCNVFHNLSNQLCFRGFVLSVIREDGERQRDRSQIEQWEDGTNSPKCDERKMVSLPLRR